LFLPHRSVPITCGLIVLGSETGEFRVDSPRVDCRSLLSKLLNAPAVPEFENRPFNLG